MRIVLFFGAILIAAAAADAQSGASIVQLDVERPRPSRVAPGQVLHLRLNGIKTSFNVTPQLATTIPLPTDFNGLSVSLEQSGGAEPMLLPLLYGAVSSSCFNGPGVILTTTNAVPCAGENYTYDVLVQIPFELKPNAPNREPCVQPPCTLNLNDAVLTVMETAGRGMSMRVYPVIDQVHLLNSCSDRITTELFGGTSDYATYPCFPAIAHVDGSWVSPTSPARVGEVVTAYAFGLGTPDAPIKTVSATPPSGLPVSRPFTLSFTGISPRYSSRPEYVGLVGGNAGLYQINFRVPPVAADLPSCDAQRPSNLTMMVQGTSSSDQASFCVLP